MWRQGRELNPRTVGTLRTPTEEVRKDDPGSACTVLKRLQSQEWMRITCHNTYPIRAERVHKRILPFFVDLGAHAANR